MGEARHLHFRRCKNVHQIMRGGLALDGRIHREDDSSDTIRHAGGQRATFSFSGVTRRARQSAAQDVIASAEDVARSSAHRSATSSTTQST